VSGMKENKLNKFRTVVFKASSIVVQSFRVTHNERDNCAELKKKIHSLINVLLLYANQSGCSIKTGNITFNQ